MCFLDGWADKDELRRTRKQLRETRIALNALAANVAKAMHDHDLELKHHLKLIRFNQRANGATRDEIGNIKDEVTGVAAGHDYRITELENGWRSLDEWAEDIATRADPDMLWADLVEKDA